MFYFSSRARDRVDVQGRQWIDKSGEVGLRLALQAAAGGDKIGDGFRLDFPLRLVVGRTVCDPKSKIGSDVTQEQMRQLMRDGDEEGRWGMVLVKLNRVRAVDFRIL